MFALLINKTSFIDNHDFLITSLHAYTISPEMSFGKGFDMIASLHDAYTNDRKRQRGGEKQRSPVGLWGLRGF